MESESSLWDESFSLFVPNSEISLILLHFCLFCFSGFFSARGLLERTILNFKSDILVSNSGQKQIKTSKL